MTSVDTLLPEPQKTAFHERARTDMQTAETYTLRDEWRIRPLEDCDPEVLKEHWGERWHYNRTYYSGRWPTVVLEHRYIRRGVEEPWTPFDAYDSVEEVLDYIASDATPFDTEHGRLLAERLAKRRAAWVKAEEDRKAKALADAEAERAATHKKQSEAAFTRLSQSPRDGIWTKRWSAFIEKYKDDETMKARILADRGLYDAVLDAVTVPTKRRAIREFLAAFEERNPKP